MASRLHGRGTSYGLPREQDGGRGPREEELRPPLIAAKPQPDFSRRELWPRVRRLTVFRESGAGLSSKKREVDVLGQQPSSYMSAD
jgi:hypothetical protein